jgi:peptide/nickel transport system substrate-binding protein
VPISPLDGPAGGSVGPDGGALPARRPYGTLAVAVCAALGVALAACAGGGPAPRATDVVSADRARTAQGGTLRWAVDAVPTTLNAFQADATDATALVDQAVLPTLFTLDAHAAATPDPDYLTGVEQTSERPQTIVYHLNPKAVWTDGRPLSAADFTAQWKALNGRDSAYWTARTDGYDSIGAIRQGATPHDVEVTFATPYAPWKQLFAPLYPAPAMSGPAAFNDGSRTRLAADAGPFTLTSVKPADPNGAGGSVTVVRNPRWWGAPARLDAISFGAVAPAARAAGLRAGTLDVADLSRAVEDGGPAVLTQASALPGVALHRASAPSFLQLTMNGGSGPLADPDLRRAVARAVDRGRIAAAVLTPLGLPDVPLGNHLVMADQQGYQDDSSALGTGGGQVRGRDGRAPALTLLTRSGSATDTGISALLTAQLARAGVRVTTRAVAGDSFFADHVTAGDFDLALFSWPASAFPVADQRPLYAKPQIGADGSLMNGQNLSGTGTDEIDRLLTQAVAALDPGQAASLADQADTRIWQQAPSLPLFQRPELVAVRTSVVGAGAFGFATPRFQDMGFTKV